MLIFNGINADECRQHYTEIPYLNISWEKTKNCTTLDQFKTVVEASDASVKHCVQWGTSNNSTLYSINPSYGISSNINRSPIPSWVNWAGLTPGSVDYLKDCNFVLKSFGFPKKLTLTGTPILADNKIGIMAIYLRTVDGTKSTPLIYWLKAFGLVSDSTTKMNNFFGNPNHHDGFWAFNGLVDLYWPKTSVEKTLTVDFANLYTTTPAIKTIMDSYAGKDTLICVHMPFSQVIQSGTTYSGMNYYLKNLMIES